MAAQSAALAPLLGMAAGALQAVGARYLALHKALAKLGYVASSLFVGLMQEGFCTTEASEEEAVGGEGGSFKEAEGTVSNVLLFFYLLMELALLQSADAAQAWR